MVIITSSQLGMGSSEWPQIQEGRTLMAPSSSARVMEQAGGLKNPTDPSLKCPRCDSSNTKFCYYNNYSLSQPRHFCKTCKRYWTRGGTLRNVPVGGGCRKNKRVKKINVSHDHHGISSSHLEPASAPANTVCSSQSILPPSNSLPVPSLRAASSAAATTATTTTANNLQSSIFLNSELNVNSSFLSSLKSLLPSGLGSFSAKESTTEGNFLLGQTGMNNTVLQLPSAASFFPVAAFPHLGNSLEFLNGHVSNDTISEAEWRQVQQQNFFLPLEELGSASAQPKVSEVAMRNMDVKIEKERNRIRQLDWQDSNHGMFETNNNSEASLYWNTSLGTWPDVPNYSSSSIASLM